MKIGRRSQQTKEESGDPSQRDVNGLVSRRQTQDDINKQFRAWPPRRIASWALIVAGVLVVAQHVVAHGGFRPLPFSMGWQDIFLGYPMGGLLAVAGLILVDPRPRI